VVFGRVTEGLPVVRRMEALGSRSGRTSQKIHIADCGEVRVAFFFFFLRWLC
jgi:hypothetical protein